MGVSRYTEHGRFEAFRACFDVHVYGHCIYINIVVLLCIVVVVISIIIIAFAIIVIIIVILSL